MRLREELRERLARAIKESGRTQSDVAREVRISEKHLSQMLNGQADGSVETWDRLFHVLTLPPPSKERVAREIERLERVSSALEAALNGAGVQIDELRTQVSELATRNLELLGARVQWVGGLGTAAKDLVEDATLMGDGHTYVVSEERMDELVKATRLVGLRVLPREGRR